MGEKEKFGGGFAWHTEVFGLKTKFIKDQMDQGEASHSEEGGAGKAEGSHREKAQGRIVR